MKNYLLVLSTVSLILSFTSCKKSSTIQPVQILTWKIDAGAEQSADTISFIRLLGYDYINASKGNTGIYVSTTSTSPGNYTHSAVTGAVGIKIGSTQYSDVSCSVTIMSNTGNRLAGNFNAVFNNGSGGTFTFNGNFSNISYY